MSGLMKPKIVANLPAGFSSESDECHIFRIFGTRAINIEEGGVFINCEW